MPPAEDGDVYIGCADGCYRSAGDPGASGARAAGRELRRVAAYEAAVEAKTVGPEQPDLAAKGADDLLIRRVDLTAEQEDNSGDSDADDAGDHGVFD